MFRSAGFSLFRGRKLLLLFVYKGLGISKIAIFDHKNIVFFSAVNFFKLLVISQNTGSGSA
jgi:hypothetical protein